MSDPVAETVAALERGHRLFAGPSLSAGIAAGDHGVHASRITAVTGNDGVPAAVQVRSGAAIKGLHALAGVDAQLASVLKEAQTGRESAAHATRVILDAAKADTIPGGDTAIGQREMMRRMLARLRAQQGHVTRSRAQSIALAARLRRLLYLRQAGMSGVGLDAGVSKASGRGAVLAAIRTALDIKGIHDPVARARWERGMDTVAQRESNYRNTAVNHIDSNARAGHASQGTFQFVPGTFNAYHEPGTSRSMNDNVAQACAFINYAQRRYGVALDGSNLASRIQQADPHRSPKGY